MHGKVAGADGEGTGVRISICTYICHSPPSRSRRGCPVAKDATIRESITLECSGEARIDTLPEKARALAMGRRRLTRSTVNRSDPSSPNVSVSRAALHQPCPASHMAGDQSCRVEIWYCGIAPHVRCGARDYLDVRLGHTAAREGGSMTDGGDEGADAQPAVTRPSARGTRMEESATRAGATIGPSLD